MDWSRVSTTFIFRGLPPLVAIPPRDETKRSEAIQLRLVSSAILYHNRERQFIPDIYEGRIIN